MSDITNYSMSTLLQQDGADVAGKELLPIEVSENTFNKSLSLKKEEEAPKALKSCTSDGSKDAVRVKECALSDLRKGFEMDHDVSSYLEAVKMKFGQNSAIYGQFLEIMNNFDRNCGNITGVIKRVSKLFNGDKELILGFNAFLPPAFRISPDSLNPTGNSTKLTISQLFPSLGRADLFPMNANHGTSDATLVGRARGHANNGKSDALSVGRVRGLANCRESETSSVDQVRGRTNYGESETSLVGSDGGQANYRASYNSLASSARDRSRSRERNSSPSFECMFNQAVSYVERAKARFGQDPEKYRRFIELLKLYHSDEFSSSIAEGPEDFSKEAKLYWEAAEIFDKDQDILDEFGKYLPDSLKKRP